MPSSPNAAKRLVFHDNDCGCECAAVRHTPGYWDRRTCPCCNGPKSRQAVDTRMYAQTGGPQTWGGRFDPLNEEDAPSPPPLFGTQIRWALDVLRRVRKARRG